MVMALNELSSSDELSQSSSQSSFVTPSESNIPLDSPMNMSNLRRKNMSKIDMSDVFQTRTESSSSSSSGNITRSCKRKLDQPELLTNSSTDSIASSCESIQR